MRTAFWESVLETGCHVPADNRLDEMTTELVAMLGARDPHVRDDLAASVLSAWVAEGVYDDLLPGLGDGLAHNLRHGLGEDGTDSVLRRSFSALLLAQLVRRDNAVHVVVPQQVHAWADRAFSWYVRERDLRGRDPELGWLLATSHGADLLGALAASRHFDAAELAVLLDVVAERLVRPTRHRWAYDEHDRLARATMSVLHRDQLDADACESWLDRLSAVYDGAVDGAGEGAGEGRVDPYAPVPSNVGGYLRALHLQLLLGAAKAPAVRGDLLLALQELLRRTAPEVLRPS